MPLSLPKPPGFRRLMVVLLLVVGLGIGLWWITPAPKERPTVRTSNGTLITLEGHAFEPGPVIYRSSDHPHYEFLVHWLPASLRGFARRPAIHGAVVPNPETPLEPVLSAAFSSLAPRGKKEGAGTRLAVSDEQGQSFDPGLNHIGGNGVFEVGAFPRRGRELTLQLMQGQESLASFKIPNPAPGPHPKWVASPLPQTAKDREFEATLEQFTVDPLNNRTECRFRIRFQERPTREWNPVSFEVSDATGNRWRPALDTASRTSDPPQVMGQFLGALWPGEEAWKLRVTFSSSTGQAETPASRTLEFLAKPTQRN